MLEGMKYSVWDFSWTELLELGESGLESLIRENYRRLSNQLRTYGVSKPGSQKYREWEYKRNIEIATSVLRNLRQPEFAAIFITERVVNGRSFVLQSREV